MAVNVYGLDQVGFETTLSKSHGNLIIGNTLGIFKWITPIATASTYNFSCLITLLSEFVHEVNCFDQYISYS